MWLFTKIFKFEKGNIKLFWVVAILCAFIFAVEHIPTTMEYRTCSYSSVFSVSLTEFMVMTLLFAPLSLVCSYFLRRFGLLSAIVIHVISDLTWRVLWQWNTGW